MDRYPKPGLAKPTYLRVSSRPNQSASNQQPISPMASTAKVLPKRSPVTSKPIATSTLKSSNSQNAIKKASTASSRVHKEKSASSISTSAAPKNTPPPSVQATSPQIDEQVEAASRIRSNSYTINRATKSPNDQNRNPINAAAGSSADGSDARDRPMFSEADFDASIGKLVKTSNGEIGTLRYFGPIEHMEGFFCGIQFDKPIGLHDGQVGSKRYFNAGFKEGTFLTMEQVQILPTTASSSSNTKTGEVAAALNADPMMLWPDGDELLTDVQPNLIDGTLMTLDGSMMANSAATFDLSSSLSFLKGNRFPGMDQSFTPSELAAQLQLDDGGAEREAMYVDDGIPIGMLVDVGADEGGYSGAESGHNFHKSSAGNSLQQYAMHNNRKLTSAKPGGGSQFGARNEASMDDGQFLNESPDVIPKTSILSPGRGNILQQPAASTSRAVSSNGQKSINGHFAAMTHAAKGFEAFGVLIRHYNETVVPGLQRELAQTKMQIVNQGNENRLLRDHYNSELERQHRAYKEKVQEVRNEFEKRMAEGNELIRQQIIDEQKAILAKKTKDNIRLEKAVKDATSEIESLRAVADMRSNDLRDAQNKNNDLAKEIEAMEKYRDQFILVERHRVELEQLVNKKAAIEYNLTEKNRELEDALRQERDRNRQLRMGQEELEFKLTQSLYETPPSQIGLRSFVSASGASQYSTPLTSKIKRSRRSRSVVAFEKTD